MNILQFWLFLLIIIFLVFIVFYYCNLFVGVPNLYMIETVDNERLAKAVNDTWGRLNKPTPIKCMAQINTSGEESKLPISLQFL